MKTTYKAITRFREYMPGETFEEELDPELERRAKERGQIRVVERAETKKQKEEEKDA